MEHKSDDPGAQDAGLRTPLRIDRPGIYQLSNAAYHADPVILPSLSRSIAKVLIDTSPAHARAAHPRLGGMAAADEPEPEPAEASEARDVGTVAHAIFLQGEQVVEVVEFDSYRTKAAKAARDDILAAGRIPLKRTAYDGTMRLVDALEAFRAKTGAFTHGKAEQTLIWAEGPIWCRCLVDWLPDDPEAWIEDLKTTGGRATTQAWTRTCFDKGADLQAAFYPRGAAELRDGIVPAGLRYHVIEQRPPYGIRTFELSPMALEVAEAKIRFAVERWSQCQAADDWPTYDYVPEMIDPPAYVLRAWEWRTRTGRDLKAFVYRGDSPLADRLIAAGNLGG